MTQTDDVPGRPPTAEDMSPREVARASLPRGGNLTNLSNYRPDEGSGVGGGPGPRPEAASVDDRGPELSPRAQAHLAAKQRAKAALAAPAVRLADCTHGDGCPVHPNVHALHDFTPTAVEALRAVLVQVRWLPVSEHALRQVVASLGLDIADVERGL